MAPVADFAVRSAAVPGTVREIRAALGTWLADAHVPAEDPQDLQHAVGELVSNAVEHASPTATRPEPGPVEVSATLTRAGQIQVHIRDHGRWREPNAAPTPTTVRGRGLWMTGRLIDDLTVEHPGGATTAFVGHRLARPDRLLTTDTLTARPFPASAPHQSLVIDHQAGRLRVAGPIDTTTAPEVATALDHAGAAGTRELWVDLTDVTHLASAGVAVLHHADARSISNGVPLLLHAPAGSPADQILTMVALPHTTEDTTAGGPAAGELDSGPGH